MAKFMMLLRDEGADFSQYSAKQFEELLAGFGKWTSDLKSKGKLVGGEKLKDEGGKTLRGVNGKTVEGGSYSKGAEMIGGYYVVHAENYDEAVSLGNGCPGLAYGGSVEIREIEVFE